jgi:hypothetical protein
MSYLFPTHIGANMRNVLAHGSQDLTNEATKA